MKKDAGWWTEGQKQDKRHTGREKDERENDAAKVCRGDGGYFVVADISAIFSAAGQDLRGSIFWRRGTYL